MQSFKISKRKILTFFQAQSSPEYLGWSRLSKTGDVNGSVEAIAKDNSNNYYIGGSFTEVAGLTGYNNIVKWDGASYDNLFGGTDGGVYAVAAANDGKIYIGGSFTTVGSIPANNVAYFDTATNTWNSLAGGVTGDFGTGGSVTAIAISGTNVYVGGDFSEVDGNFINCIARWDSSTNTWNDLLDTSGNSPFVQGNIVRSIAITGNNVYVGGLVSAQGNIVRWDGTRWNNLKTINGTNAATSNLNGSCESIAVGFNNNIYVGGFFSRAGGTSAAFTANRLAVWNPIDLSWSPIIVNGINGVSGSGSIIVNTLTFNNNNLYVGGNFSSAGDISAQDFAIYNGTRWSTLPGSTFNDGGDGEISTILVNNNNVYVGGSFTTPQSYIAVNNQIVPTRQTVVSVDVNDYNKRKKIL